MGWFKNIFKTVEDTKEAEAPAIILPGEAPKSLVVTSELPKKKPYVNGNLRANRWVVVEGKVGIVTSYEPELSSVDFVGQDGLTYANARVPTGLIRLAKWAEIPACRLVGLSEVDAMRLGYSIS